MLRRTAGDLTRESTVTVGTLEVSPDARVAWLDGNVLDLAPRELDIARRTAGGTLRTSPSPLGGARVTLLFPPTNLTGEILKET